MKDFARSAATRARAAHRHARAGRWLLLCAMGVLAGATPAHPDHHAPPAHPNLSLRSVQDGAHDGAIPAEQPPPPPTAAAIPGLGPKTLALLPPGTRQVLVASGSGVDSSDTTARLWTADDSGRWTAGPVWQAHNARRGWTTDHRSGDLRSPIGVFSLSDAGGQLPDPGAKLPYYRSNAFTIAGTGFEGEQLAGAFDYVVAIDYNRVAGRSPLDADQPLGSRPGGGIWLHVDHGGPTHGCITLAKDDLRALLTLLDPADHPVIAMGPADRLGQ